MIALAVSSIGKPWDYAKACCHPARITPTLCRDSPFAADGGWRVKPQIP
jgi:hypothetical protein